MPTIIICTDFSETSRNALLYTCNLVKEKVNAVTDLLLLHVFAIPSSYAGEALSLVTISDEWNDAEAQLQDELNWVHEQFPMLSFRTKIIAGQLNDGLQEQLREEDVFMVVIGAGGHYGELLSWDAEILDLLRNLPVPVLTVPKAVAFTSVASIAFACDLKNVSPATPFVELKNIAQFVNAKLHILFVNTRESDQLLEKQNEPLVHNALDEISPDYHFLKESQVASAVGHFVHANDIQLLLVTPRKHGVWENLFHKSNTMQLMRLNSIPIIALHGR